MTALGLCFAGCFLLLFLWVYAWASLGRRAFLPTLRVMFDPKDCLVLTLIVLAGMAVGLFLAGYGVTRFFRNGGSEGGPP